MTGVLWRIERENEQLADRLRSMTRTAGELCALEAAGHAATERDQRRALLREALSAGFEPAQLGLTFVVALAECAYELQWGEQFSFWPQIAAILNAPAWDPLVLAAREQCTAAFKQFSQEHGGLEPQGRFAESYSHVSWPLFHAVLPRAAQRRMSKLLAKAAADPRFVVSADGTIDDRELTVVLRAFAAASSMPAYFEGILQHPTLGGRLGANLIRSAKETATSAGTLSRELIDRVLHDLSEDRVAREQLEEATEEATQKRDRARRRQRADEDKLEPLLLGLALERHATGIRAFLEAGPLTPSARDWNPLAKIISQHQARVAVMLNDNSLPLGYLVNVAYGAVSVGVSWPTGDSLTLSVDAQTAAGLPLEDEIARYFARSRRALTLPLVFAREGESGRYRLAPAELRGGANIVIVVAKRSIRGLEGSLKALGLDVLSVAGTADPIAVAGRLPVEAAELQSLAKAFTLRRGRPQGMLRPSIVPPLRQGPGWLEWGESTEPFVEVCATDASRLRLSFEVDGERRELALMLTPNGSHVARVPDGPGDLVLGDLDGEVARVRVTRSGRASFRESSARLRVHVMPGRAARDQLLGEAVWLDVEALPGVQLRIALSGGGHTEEEYVDAAEATPLHTAALLARMRRRIHAQVGEGSAANYVLSVSNADEPSQPATIVEFGDASGPVMFVAEHDRGVLRSDANADPAALSRLSFGPRGVSEYRQEFEPIISGAREGIHLGRVGPACAALAWAAEGPGFPRHAHLGCPRRGMGRSLDVVGLLRACETATLAPSRRLYRAAMVRNAAVNSLHREVVASLCGQRWLRREETCDSSAHGRGESVQPLIEALGPLLWLQRSWLQHDFAVLVDEWSDPIEALERACHDGVGDDFTADDARHARHLFLLFTRSAMATIDEDQACLVWANSNVLRPRLVRLFYLAWPTGLERRIQALDEAAEATEVAEP